MPIPSHSIGHAGHAPDMPALQIPCQSHQKNISVLCYIYPVYFWLPRLSRWGIPPPRPPPWYGRARPCARAERERGGSGAAAERRTTGTSVAIAQPQHPAVHQRGTPHVQRQKQPSAAATPQFSPLTSLPCCSTWHMAGCSPHSTPCAHARSAVPCVTERECPRNGT